MSVALAQMLGKYVVKCLAALWKNKQETIDNEINLYLNLYFIFILKLINLYLYLNLNLNFDR